MITTVRAIYESKGVLRLLQPLQLPEGSEVKISLELPTPISDPAYDLATLAVDGGPSDLAHEHDHYLYGAPKRGIAHDQ
jgi:predicted DNA-binding antitoxin AbrB/MazE fold protein